MLDKQAILIGYSGHSYVIAEVALENNIDLIGYSDKEKLLKNPLNLKYLGFETNKRKTASNLRFCNVHKTL